MRERLMELIRQAKKKTKGANCDIERNMIFAEHLLENGVIVPPCKVGDKVYIEIQGKIKQGTVILIRPFVSKKGTIFKGNVIAEIDLWGEAVEHDFFVVFKEPCGIERVAYITKEEAEAALKGGAE